MWPFRRKPLDQPPVADYSDLLRRVRALEDSQLELLTAWEKTRGQVLRYMKRAGALRGRLDAEPLPDSDQDDEPSPELDRMVFNAKFGR